MAHEDGADLLLGLDQTRCWLQAKWICVTSIGIRVFQKNDAPDISMGGDLDGVCIFARVPEGDVTRWTACVKNLHLDDYLLWSGGNSRASNGHEEWKFGENVGSVSKAPPVVAHSRPFAVAVRPGG